MRFIALVTAVALAASSAALAQNGTGGDGDSPQNKGSTSWTGGHPEIGGTTQQSSDTPDKPKAETTGQKVAVHDQAETKDQPVMATGVDLHGPGKQFPPSQTPE